MFETHLLGLVEAMLITVGEVESCELISQFLLRADYHVQCCVQFSVTGTLFKEGKTSSEKHLHTKLPQTLPNLELPLQFMNQVDVFLTCCTSLLRIALTLALILSWPSAVS